ncbi:seizure protein 6 homolog [Lampris incognitus]|uniref:seizure protein 6 homolog n=1 Tax=Lampris incognitus TaxID=2546036 RepID=UPI0024B5C2D6|nr:seizure protein 6 homolog [Lampris incognitus]
MNNFIRFGWESDQETRSASQGNQSPSVAEGSSPGSGASFYPTTQDISRRLPVVTTAHPVNIPNHHLLYRNLPPEEVQRGPLSQPHHFKHIRGVDPHQTMSSFLIPQFDRAQPAVPYHRVTVFPSPPLGTQRDGEKGASGQYTGYYNQGENVDMLTTHVLQTVVHDPYTSISNPANTMGWKHFKHATAIPSEITTGVEKHAIKPDQSLLNHDTTPANTGTLSALSTYMDERTTTTSVTTSTTTQSQVPCQFNLTGPEGYIEAPPQFTSGFYSPVDCTYIITIYTGYGVEIQVKKVNLSEGDRVMFADLGGGGKTMLANESILIRGLVVRSYSNQITVHYKSHSPVGSSVLLHFQAFVLSCTFPQRPAHGDVSVSSLHSGGTALFYCLKGYQLRGLNTLTCRNASTPYWSDKEPQCLATCGGLIRNITSGRIVSPGFPSNYSNNLTCHWLLEAPEGHRLHIHFEKVALAEDDDRLLIRNGNNTDAAALYDSYEVEYLPNEGLVSTSRHLFIELTTDATGTSNGIAIRYQAFAIGHCYEPFVKYGNLTSSDTTWAVGAMVEFSCDPGYTLEQGSVIIECVDHSNPQWNETEPACRAVCSGEITDSAGVVLSPNWPEAYDKGQDCIWGIHVEEDKRIMLDIQVLHIGKNDFLTFYDGDDLTAKVLGQYRGAWSRFKLYTSTADITIQFQSDPATNVYGYGYGFIVHFFEVVRNDTCPELPEISSGWKSASNPELVHGTVVTYQCYPGYQVVGTELLMCQWDLTWSGDLPSCERVVTCADPGRVEHSQRVLTGPRLTVGSTIQYVCNQGYTLSGNSLLTCYHHGSVGPRWSQKLPRCLPETFEPCSHPGIPTYGVPSSDKRVFEAGETLHYSCLSGHKLLGEPVLRCVPGHPSQWSGLPPVCRGATVDLRAEGAHLAFAILILVTLLLIFLFGMHLYFSNVDEKIAKDLGLSTYNTAEDIFRALAKRHGTKSTIALEIIGEQSKIPPVKGNQPRKIAEREGHQIITSFSAQEEKPRGVIRRNCRKTAETKKGLTEEQEKFLGELSPALTERCRKAFTNKSAKVNCAAKSQLGILKESGLRELPVIMMLMEVTANAGQKIGTLVDLASDTNYITLEAVNSLKEITKIHKLVRPEQLKKFFPEVELEELKRSERIELLISHRKGRLTLQRVKVVGDRVLWASPLGKTVGGVHPDLFEEINVTAQTSETHFARSMRTAAVKYDEITSEVPFKTKTVHLQNAMVETKHLAASHREFLEWWKWDSIGAACEPKCGGCCCGNCQPEGEAITSRRKGS